MKPAIHPPFSCTYTPQLPELLMRLKCSLIITTFQAGKVIFISPKNEQELVQLPRTFSKPMGIVADNDRLALAADDELILFQGNVSLAQAYPKNPGTYDMMFLPTTTFQIGKVDMHDIHWLQNELVAVNTSFSCIIKVDSYYNFVPIWQPPFVTTLASEDRCHLNGMALDQGKIKYATAFGTGDSPRSWRATIPESGVLIDVERNEVIAENLAMPHSPRIFEGSLYLLLSAQGALAKVNPENGKLEIIYQREGFARGLARYGDYLFIGYSKLRKNSSVFGKLPFSEKAVFSGVAVLHEPSGAVVGEMRYHTSVDEIYDIQVLPGYTRPNILSNLSDEYKRALITPQASYWGKKQ